MDLEGTHDRTGKERTTPLEGDNTTLPEQERDREPISEDDVRRMRQVFEEAKRVVKPIVKRESGAEVVSVELFNIRLKDACRA